MAPLLTTAQARWVLTCVLGVLCVTAIASSAPSSAGGTDMYSGGPGDIRGVVVLVSAVALVGVVLLRLASAVLPAPWQAHVDRLEFSFVAMLWILWTTTPHTRHLTAHLTAATLTAAATLAFSAFTLELGVCNRALSDVFLPTCPLLTLDMALLHLLGVSSLALVLAVFSAALHSDHPSRLSLLSPAADRGARGAGSDDVLIMWDMAVASAPSSPVADRGKGFASYGATESTEHAARGPRGADGQEQAQRPAAAMVTRDKFAAGRTVVYSALGACSVVVLGAGVGAMDGDHLGPTLFLVLVALLSLTFSLLFLVLHFTRGAKAADDDGLVRQHERALELAVAGALFLLWPLAAITYTVSPPTANQPCLNPSASAAPFAPVPPPELSTTITHALFRAVGSHARATASAPPAPAYALSTCALTCLAVGAAWAASAIVLARIAGVVVPVPSLARPAHASAYASAQASAQASAHASGHGSGEGEDVEPLLGTASAPADPDAGPAAREAYGRLVAGEAFELGDDDDDDY
ncbi:hypothetical protein Q5752_005025 [Cryptotrichosporon argae]